VGRRGQVEIETPQHPHNFLVIGVDQIERFSGFGRHEGCKARGEIGDCSSAVRNDEADVGAARERARQDETVDRARAIERIFQDWRRQAEAQARESRRFPGMNEDYGLAMLQLVEQRRKVSIAEIGARVVCQDADAIETEGIECV